MVVGLVLVGVLSAPELSASVTMGLGADAAPGGPVLASSVVAARVRLIVPLPAGTVRLTLAPATLSVGSTAFWAARLQDLGTRVEVEFPVGEALRLAVRVDPFNAVLRRVTHDWANVVGRPRFGTGFAPVVSVDLGGERWNGFLAARPTLRANPVGGALEPFVDVLGGAALRLGSWSLDARVARFESGLAQDGFSTPIRSVLGTGRVAWTLGHDVGQPIDFVTYADDPARFERFLGPMLAAPEGVAVTASLEGGAGAQRLVSAERFMATVEQALGYADVQLRAQVGPTRVFAIGRLASASFLVHDEPGAPRSLAFPEGLPVTPSWSAFLAADHAFSRGRLVPGVMVRLLQPAMLQGPRLDFGGTAPPPGFVQGQVFALDALRSFAALPPGTQVVPRVLGMVTLRYVPRDDVSFVGEVSVERDQNSGVALFVLRGQVLAQVRL